MKDKSDDREDEETEEDDVSDDDVSIAKERGNDESGFSEDEKTDDKTVDGKNEVALPVEKRIYFRDSGRTPQSSFVRYVCVVDPSFERHTTFLHIALSVGTLIEGCIITFRRTQATRLQTKINKDQLVIR